MHNDYTIGQFSKLVGLSAETIRHYERSGLLQSYRHPSNQYRIYSFEDILPVLNIRQQRSIGLSVPDLATALQNIPQEQQLKLIKTKETEIDLQIERLEQMKKSYHRLYQRIERSQKAQSPEKNVVHEALPNAYRLTLFSLEGKAPSYPQELMQKWIEEIYFTHISVILSDPYTFDNKFGNISIGLEILESVQNIVHLPITNSIEQLPQGQGIALSMKVNNPMRLKPTELAPIYQFREENGITKECDIAGSIDYVYRENGEFQYYMTFRTLIE